MSTTRYSQAGHKFIIDGIVDAGETIIVTVQPMSGYRFVSWSDGVIDNPREIYIEECGLTYTGIFDIAPMQYTVRFDANGGNGVVPQSQTVYSDEYITLPSYFGNKTGYTQITGWSENPQATEPDYMFGEDFYPEHDTILYAVWKEDVVPTFYYSINERLDMNIPVVVDFNNMKTIKGNSINITNDLVGKNVAVYSVLVPNDTNPVFTYNFLNNIFQTQFVKYEDFTKKSVVEYRNMDKEGYTLYCCYRTYVAGFTSGNPKITIN